MKRYFREIGLSGKRLASRIGVSHSQIYMARARNVGADNAEKISSYIADTLRLSIEEKLALKAEIMGDPGNLVRAYLVNDHEAGRTLGIPSGTAWWVVNGRPVPHPTGIAALAKLKEIGAPEVVIEELKSRVKPPPSPPGKRTHNLSGEDIARNRREAQRRLPLMKPNTHQAIERSGLKRIELADRAGVGKETLRAALYERSGEGAARKIVDALGLKRSSREREAVIRELTTDSRNS